MRPYFEREPGAQPLAYVANVSWPRSGHHLLARILERYFGPRFGYCEYHVPRTDPQLPCCGQFPCTRQDVISMSKNHDFDLASPVPAKVPLIVQWREPLAAIQSEFELALLDGVADSPEAFAAFAEKRAATYRRFMAKWLEAPIETRLAVEYDEFVADPLSIMTDVLALWNDGPVDMGRLQNAIERVSHVSVRQRAVHIDDRTGVRSDRSVEAFRYYDEELAQSISAIALGKAAAPFRATKTRRSTVGATTQRPETTARPPAAPEEAPRTAAQAGSGSAQPAEADGEKRHRLEPGERLVLMLLPGCGGAALSRAIAAQFDNREIFRGTADVLPEMSQEDLRRYRFFTGHFSKYGVDAVPGPKRVVTLLSDPRQRVLRIHAMWRAEEGEGRSHPAQLAQSMDRADLLASKDPAVVGVINNHMVRALLGPVRLGGTKAFRLVDPSFCVEAALTNLKRMSFVTFADTLAQDAELLAELIGMTPVEPDLLQDAPLRVPIPPLDEPERAQLHKLTHLDMGLYRRAREMRHTLRCPYPL